MMKKKGNIALGFYQNLSMAITVAKELRAKGHRKVACIQNTGTEVNVTSRHGIDKAVLDYYKQWVLKDEALVIAQISTQEVREVFQIIRQRKSWHPVSFLIRAPISLDIFKETDLPKEPLSIEQLQLQAIEFAKSQKSDKGSFAFHKMMLKRLKKSADILSVIRHEVSEAEYIEQITTLPAEWLLDNTYVIQGAIENIQKNFSKKYSSELPVILTGSMEGFPRIYAIAEEIINHTAGKLNRDNIVSFLKGFLSVEDLTIGELWALPIMLRLRLVECIQTLALHIDIRMHERELANFWGNRLLNVIRREPALFPNFLAGLEQAQPKPSSHFAEELLDHLFDEEDILPSVKKYLEERFGISISEIMTNEQKLEAAEQVAFSNAIVSLITLSQLSWREIVESLSPVDAILCADPAEVYGKMDFETRDSYRHAVEQIARHSQSSERSVAQGALNMAQTSTSEIGRHVGYYLVDDGRPILEKKVGCRLSITQKLHRSLQRHATLFYLSSIGLITFLIEAYFFYLAFTWNVSLLQIILMGILALIPISELSLQLVNLLVTQIFSPVTLPKMSFEKGLPPECKTLVVVPTIFSTVQGIQENIDNLEIRYLANSDPAICFSLFSDYPDAADQKSTTDQAYIEAAVKGLAALEGKYGPGKFFLFHRERKWSDSENAWIGWERKRGKLECLNRFLLNGPSTQDDNILYFGQPEALKGIRYVITLDEDTQMPKDKARQMVETIAHPLNRPCFSEDKRNIQRGYSIIQPRVSTDFPHAKVTLFARIFSDPGGLDPYTHVISDVYQDLFREGNYHGKGIYDLHAFHSILANRFPDEQLLSHDLLEGAFSRVGYASDICLFDLFPEDYMSWSKRQHRWTRGDWQILDWLFPYVKNKDGQKETNTLSAINRWKIFDNLRRSLLPITMLLLLICGWLFSSMPATWTILIAIVLLMPTVSTFVWNLFKNPYAQIFAWSEPVNGLVRSIICTAFLPHQALLTVDAILRTLYRQFLSHKYLLEWNTARNTNGGYAPAHYRFLSTLGWCSIFAIAILIAVAYADRDAEPMALPFALLWAFTPLIIVIIDRPIVKTTKEALSRNDRTFLRLIARKTWRYFDDFVGPNHNWLPPDNYQTALKIELAPRTSPTNIGLWLLAALSAYDFKYITAEDLIQRITATAESLKKLDKFKGHFLNWYDIQTLKPLYPRYISTVDSGNFVASLWAFQQGLDQLLLAPLLPSELMEGVQDTFRIYKESKKAKSLPSETTLNSIFKKTWDDTTQLSQDIDNALETIQELNRNEDPQNSIGLYWLKQTEKLLQSWKDVITIYYAWIPLITSITDVQLHSIDPQAINWRDVAVSQTHSLYSLATQALSVSLSPLIEKSLNQSMPLEIQQWGGNLKAAIETAEAHAKEHFMLAQAINEQFNQISKTTEMHFLYNLERKVFTIGCNVDEQRLDNSYYDLLASEARIASLISIAKGDVPLEHWWSLSRPYSTVEGTRVLLSWGGTMFEYLMPLLFTKHYSGSLLGEACEAAVTCQIKYGNKRAIPWGVSECAFSAIDAHKTYQYRSFGIPGLGLKRDLEEDLVVSPYSTALAVSLAPALSIKNLKRLSEGNVNLLGSFGYYDSIDFTRQIGPSGERGVTVYTFMAHHQGMSVISINNLLNNEAMRNRFHADPRICGIESLLYERIPRIPPVTTRVIKEEAPISRLQPFSTVPIMGVMETYASVIPKVNILSNGEYSAMVTNAGGGYSRWRNFDITRWRSDTTQDNWGKFYYIKDVEEQRIWSVGFHPTNIKGKHYSVSFKADKAEFRRRDDHIDTFTEILVSPEDNAEIWLFTFANLSKRVRTLEMTSYMELALAPHAADRQHPCFNKLFIETEAIPEQAALLAFRRLRSKEDPPIFALHAIAAAQSQQDILQFETDRNKFIGRGRSLKHPVGLDTSLSNTSGTILDPIFSLRRKIVLEPGQRQQLSFVTAVADNKNKILSLLEKYKDLSATHRACDLAWNYAQLELRHLRIDQEEAQLFQKLASRVLYPHSQLRASKERIRSNRLGQSALWPHGISGDNPIIAVMVGDIHDTDFVRQTLIGHAFLRLRGLTTDLVILNEEAMGYENPLYEQLQRMIRTYGFQSDNDKAKDIFLLNTEQLPENELTLILAAANVVLIAARGSLRHQTITLAPKYPSSDTLIPNKKIQDVPSTPLPFIELPYFNGTGGYSQDGSTYVIYLGPDTNTPSPWINVIANPHFGTMVSEKGIGCTWYENSQTYRLTPWSNDPLLDPISDAIFLRDEDLGTVWSPTPGPIRELDAYRIHHGHGFTRFEHHSHGIEQELLVFVPMDENDGKAFRIQRMRLFNNSNRRRRISITSYNEWILGTDKETSQLHITTEWDPESQALLANNRYHPDFGNRTTFATSTPVANSFTADRAEFIGRNATALEPLGMKVKALSGQTGATLDACSALRIVLELEPGETKDAYFMLGSAPNPETARNWISQYRNKEALDQLFNETKNWWNQLFNKVQVDIPDLAMKFALNRWLLYQTLSCRIWGRSAFYQSSGAFGFRDQLQDVMALVYAQPHIAREHILRAASRQFEEGDVQHWWHPPSGAGIRTRISDDLLWLPFATAHYVRTTGDVDILNEQIPFLKAPALEDNQAEAYMTPEISTEQASLLEHCRRALHKGLTSGAHGLPLIGSGDWNDGMNLVGIKGQGESVWLGWFLIHVLNDFADILEVLNEQETGKGCRIQAKRLAEAIEATSWDGEWYRRAYFDDGTPIGSKANTEDYIDNIAQSWAVISGGATPERAAQALKSALEHLVNQPEKLVLLLTPPFDKSEMDPGYIKGYPPGVRENGGQYTHGSLWLALAYARMGNGDLAAKLSRMMHPIEHTNNESEVAKYKGEPYVLAGDVYALPGQYGRSGWTWYSGSSGWMYRIWLEEILGFKLRGKVLILDPSIPSQWDRFKINYQFGHATYDITVENPSHLSRGSLKVELDGKHLPSKEIPLTDDGKTHTVTATITP